MPYEEPKSCATGVKFIVASWYKNRTKTTADVFKTLGFNVYDFVEHQVYNSKYWLKFLDNGNTKEERLQILRSMHKGVDVVLDMPVHVFWKELSEAFPEAKVVFYARDEEGWTRSAERQHEIMNNMFWVPDEIKNLFLRIFAPESYLCHLHFVRFCRLCVAGEEAFSGFRSMFRGPHVFNKFLAQQRFRRHNADVLQNCPKDRLLHLTDETFSWETFCDFVGVEMPRDAEGKVKEFPHANKKGQFIEDYGSAESPQNELLKRELCESLKWLVLVLTAVFVAMFFA